MNDDFAKKYIQPAMMVLRWLEDAILVILFSLMIAMAVLQILLRNLFDTGIVWSDVMVRNLVLWVGLVGAMVATRGDKHININLVARFLPENAKGIADITVKLFAAAICSIAAFYSLRFVKLEFQDGGVAFGQVPTWVCEVIIPFAFAVIAVRFLIMAVIRYICRVNL